jgi:adenosylcobinamide kinase / adenosylcobinamide-phosphate guanylyltransferase
VRTLVLGGVRSGKSRYAESAAARSNGAVAVIVTGTPDDAEMSARIAAHRARRPAHWRVREAPTELGAAIEAERAPGAVVLVDCLTLWLSNLLALDDPEVLCRERDRLMTALTPAAGRTLLVSNEVGLGVVPVNALARRFIDEAGTLHQQLAQLCDEVVWMVAGVPVVVKPRAEGGGRG